MNSTPVDPTATDLPPVYRAVSRLAICTFLVGLFSLSALLFRAMLIVPAIGVVLVWVSRRHLRRYRRELTGGGMVRVAGVLCWSSLLVGAIVHTVLYINEVPEGYIRVTFEELQPLPSQPNLPPPLARQLDGRKVWIRGFIYPTSQDLSIRQFVLVPYLITSRLTDRQPDPTEKVHVILQNPLRINVEPRTFAIGGVFHADTRLRAAPDVDGVFYRIDADYAKPSIRLEQ